MKADANKNIINRLKRIEGQIRGLEKLVEKDASCLDILTQVSAVTGAVKKTGMEVIQMYLNQCLVEASTLSAEEREEKMAGFQKALVRYIDMA